MVEAKFSNRRIRLQRPFLFLFIIPLAVVLYVLNSVKFPLTKPCNAIAEDPFPRDLRETSTLYSGYTRKVANMMRDTWRLSQNLTEDSVVRQHLEDMAIEAEARVAHMDTLSGQAEIRRLRLIELAEKLQKDIYAAQNPPDCSKAQFLVTPILFDMCGFGCQVHSAAFALHRSLAMNRTLFLLNKEWYDMFMPLTSCPFPGNGPNVITQSPLYQPPIVGPYSTPGLTREWATNLKELHDHPYAWFRGNLLRFILRFRPSTFSDELFDRLANVRKHPIVGLHVRRTDKILEASIFPVDQYMPHVGFFFKKLQLEHQLRIGNRSAKLSETVYMASDEENVFTVAQTRFPQYTYIRSPITTIPKNRTSKEGMEAILTEIFELANCDYVVCTFSSNVCRIVFELMLTKMDTKGDRSGDVHSIDKMYYTHKERKRTWRVMHDIPSTNLTLGSLVTIVQNFWNGSVVTDTGYIVPAYLLDEEPLLLPGY